MLLAFPFANVFIGIFEQGLARIGSTEVHFTRNGHQRFFEIQAQCHAEIMAQ